jgi:small basic protein
MELMLFFQVTVFTSHFIPQAILLCCCYYYIIAFKVQLFLQTEIFNLRIKTFRNVANKAYEEWTGSKMTTDDMNNNKKNNEEL